MSKVKVFMCNACGYLYGKRNPSYHTERHTCKWCGKQEWGHYVDNKPPQNKQGEKTNESRN